MVDVYCGTRHWWMFTVGPDTSGCLPWDQTLMDVYIEIIH